MQRTLWQMSLALFGFCCLIIAWQVAPIFSAPRFSSSAAPRLIQSGLGYDPLTANEADRALAFALQANEAARQSAAASVRANLPLEILSVERYDVPKVDQKTSADRATLARQGEVYLYDYASDTLIHTIVDLAAGTTTTEQLQGIQLPLTIREEERAIQLIREDADLWSALGERYRLITGDELRTTEQLQVKVSLFLGEAMADQVNDAARRCGQHRCAQVLLFTIDRTLLEVLPIVDLSQGKVVQLLSDSWLSPQGATATEKAGASW